MIRRTAGDKHEGHKQEGAGRQTVSINRQGFSVAYRQAADDNKRGDPQRCQKGEPRLAAILVAAQLRDSDACRQFQFGLNLGSVA